MNHMFWQGSLEYVSWRVTDDGDYFPPYSHSMPQREDGRCNDSISITLRSAKESANTLGINRPYKAYLFLYVESLDCVPPSSSFVAIVFDLRDCKDGSSVGGGCYCRASVLPDARRGPFSEILGLVCEY